jgi:large subunit ribosomal protein L25
VGDTALAVEVREGRGKGAARRLRVDGRIPGIVYGKGHGNVAISLDPAELDGIIKTSHGGINTLIDLEGAAEVAGRTVLVKELQREPVYGTLVHADLYELDLTQKQRVSVPIHLTGTALGVTMGGLLDHALRELEVDCLASSIPDEIVIDVTDLEQGHSLHVSDLVVPAGVEVHTAADLPVVSVVAPKAEEEPVQEELAEGEEGAEAAAGADAPAGDAGDGGGESSES